MHARRSIRPLSRRGNAPIVASTRGCDHPGSRCASRRRSSGSVTGGPHSASTPNVLPPCPGSGTTAASTTSASPSSASAMEEALTRCPAGVRMQSSRRPARTSRPSPSSAPTSGRSPPAIDGVRRVEIRRDAVAVHQEVGRRHPDPPHGALSQWCARIVADPNVHARQEPPRRLRPHGLDRTAVDRDAARLRRAVDLAQRHAEPLAKAARDLGREPPSDHREARRDRLAGHRAAAQHVGHHRRPRPVVVRAGREQPQERGVIEAIEQRERRARHRGGHEAMVQAVGARERQHADHPARAAEADGIDERARDANDRRRAAKHRPRPPGRPRGEQHQPGRPHEAHLAGGRSLVGCRLGQDHGRSERVRQTSARCPAVATSRVARGRPTAPRH